MSTNTKIQGKLAGLPRWISGLFKPSTPEKSKLEVRKNPGYYFKGLYDNIEWNSSHYFNVNATRFELMAKGFKHHAKFFDVMIESDTCFYINENGEVKNMSLIQM